MEVTGGPKAHAKAFLRPHASTNISSVLSNCSVLPQAQCAARDGKYFVAGPINFCYENPDRHAARHNRCILRQIRHFLHIAICISLYTVTVTLVGDNCVSPQYRLGDLISASCHRRVEHAFSDPSQNLIATRGGPEAQVTATGTLRVPRSARSARTGQSQRNGKFSKLARAEQIL